jgi:hypothetical protein
VNRFRRATAFVLTLLLIQLMLVGSGFTCVTGEEDAGAAMADRDMAGMAGMAGMSGMAEMAPMAGMSANLPNPEPSGMSSDSSSRDSAPCNLPWAPSGCTVMIPCGPHAVMAQVQAIAGRQVAGHADVAQEIATPPSAIIALDTPPPRA